ncbi:MAG: glycosyltransferase, partial [Thermonemataceae bacterium]|nr:glycosyltransferase [Thermonemataceae bacterium]
MLYVFLAILVSYLVLIFIFYLAWLKIPVFSQNTIGNQHISVSVVIVFRNEAANLASLLADLENQTYPKKLWNVIFIDDFSEDNSYQILEKYKESTDLQLHILKNNEFTHILSPKKRAITQAVKHSQQELIICTDADCSFGSEWLGSITNFYQQSQAYFISSPVRFEPVQSLFELWQAVEFSSLIGSGAACIQLGKPTMCNGANIAYPKKIFESLGGFAGSEHVISGDDEFLMHKIAQKYPQKIHFLKSKAAIVSTKAAANLKIFFEQRKRWASKWENYQNPTAKYLALFIFINNLATVIAGISIFFGGYSEIYYYFAFKFLIEFIFLASVLNFFGQSRLWFWILPLFWVYP